MKNFKSCFIVFCAISILVFSACKNEKKDDPQPASSFAYSESKLEKRWEVSNNTRTSGAPGSTLIAVEFVGNAFVLYFPSDSIVTGTYTTSGSDVIVLGSFGTLKINTLTDTNFGFELEVNGVKEVFTSAKATQEIPDSDFTAKICKTWKLTEFVFNGETERPADSEVTFNKYGTYLTKDSEGGITDIATNTWMWSNEGTEICYGAWDGGNISNCDGLGHVSLTFSNDGKKLTMVENVELFGEVIYILELK